MGQKEFKSEGVLLKPKYVFLLLLFPNILNLKETLQPTDGLFLPTAQRL